MPNFLRVFLGGIGGAVQGVSRGVATFTGDKVQREANTHDEQQSVLDAYASENAQVRVNRTWWDSFVDGLNRLPRPILAFEVIALPHWAILDPTGFAAAMTALRLMPEWLALIIGQVVLLFCGGRMLDKWPSKFKGPSLDEVRAVLDAQREIRAAGPQLPDKAFTEQMADTDKPLTNEAILEWNRRRGLSPAGAGGQ